MRASAPVAGAGAAGRTRHGGALSGTPSASGVRPCSIPPLGPRVVTAVGPACCTGLDRVWAPPSQALPSRRGALAGLVAGGAAGALTLGAGGAAWPRPAWAEAAAPGGEAGERGAEVAALLQRRFDQAQELTSPGNSMWSRPQVIPYPKWMFGEWEVRATLAAFTTPLGPSYVEPALLAAAGAPPEQGGVGSTTTYRQRFFATLPDTFANQMAVMLGQQPQGAVVADRAFNTRTQANAYLGFEGVSDVQYDPRAEPNRATVNFATTVNGRRLPPKRYELYINNTQFGPLAGAARPTYLTSELLRQVSLGVGDVSVSDYEVLTRWELLREGGWDAAGGGFTAPVVSGRQLSAVYLDPRQPGYFAARGRAVAVYEFALEAVRVAGQGEGGEPGCVLTPKDVYQCA